jgi:hypothetical protein
MPGASRWLDIGSSSIEHGRLKVAGSMPIVVLLFCTLFLFQWIINLPLAPPDCSEHAAIQSRAEAPGHDVLAG